MLVNKEKSKFLDKIEKNLYLFDRDLKIIDREILIRKSKLDILALDDLGKLILIEVGISNPENLIFKALDHFDWILHNMQRLQNKYNSYNIDYTIAPEIILMAKEFSKDFQRRVSYIKKGEVYLYKFKEMGEEKLKIFPVEFSFDSNLYEKKEKTPAQIIKVIESNEVRDKCRECISYIYSLKDNLEIDTTKRIIQFNYEGSYFAAIYPFGRFFWVNFNPDYWSGKKIDKSTKLNFNVLVS